MRSIKVALKGLKVSVPPARWKFFSLVFFFAVHVILPVAEAQSGRVEQAKITSDELTNNLFGDPATRSLSVYLPPSYDDGSERRYPVVYVLHGYGGSPADMVSVIRPTLESMTRARVVSEMIMVFVDGGNRLGGSFYLNSPVIGDYESYIAKDLVAYVDGRYRTLAHRESRGITGYSMGGWGAMHLSLKFPETFSVVVSEAGVYDANGKLLDGLCRQLASAHPTNLTQFGKLAFPVNAAQALLAGLLPNPERPQLFTDNLYDLAGEQTVANTIAQQQAREGDVQHGDLGRYLNKTNELRAIKIVHGVGDAVVGVSEARAFSNALTTAGIEIEYQEHAGGHDYVPGLALPFLSTNLVGAELYLSRPKLAVANTPDGLALTFPTQKGVTYSVETILSLSGKNLWIGTGERAGDGQPAKISLPLDTNGAFFRVRSANAPM